MVGRTGWSPPPRPGSCAWRSIGSSRAPPPRTSSGATRSISGRSGRPMFPPRWTFFPAAFKKFRDNGGCGGLSGRCRSPHRSCRGTGRRRSSISEVTARAARTGRRPGSGKVNFMPGRAEDDVLIQVLQVCLPEMQATPRASRSSPVLPSASRVRRSRADTTAPFS